MGNRGPILGQPQHETILVAQIKQKTPAHDFSLVRGGRGPIREDGGDVHGYQPEERYC